MRKAILSSFLMSLLTMLSVSKGQILSSDNDHIRVMSYNIHYSIGMDGVYSLDNIAAVIKKADPDLVGLQEIGDSLMAAELGRLTAMNVVFGPSLGKMDGYGDAILSKYPFKWVGNEPIPSASSSRYQAMAVDVDLSSKSAKIDVVRFINTHFDWLSTIGSEYARLASVDVIEQAFLTDSAIPAILTGDLNAVPTSDVLKKLGSVGWVNHQNGGPYKTINSIEPTRQIDYVLYRRNHQWKVKNAFVMYGEESSDHLPIVLDLLP